MEQRPVLQTLTIASIDLFGYGRLMEQDESNTHLSVIKCLRDVLRPIVARHHGEIVKSTGDGALVTFHNPTNAVDGMIAFQQQVAALNIARPGDQLLEFRIGIHSSVAIVDNGDLYGRGVNLAVRLQEVGDPGSILISQSVLNQLEDRITSKFSSFGNALLKNTRAPILTYRWDNGSSSGSSKLRIRKPILALASLLLALVLPLNTSSKDPIGMMPKTSQVRQLSEFDRLESGLYARPTNEQKVASGRGKEIEIFLQAWVHYARNTSHDLKKSHKYLRRLIITNPNNDEIHSLIAAVYWRAWYNRWHGSLGLNVADSLKLAQYHLSKVHTPIAIAHMVTSEMMTANGNLAGAIAEADRAIAAHPRMGVGYYAKGLALVYSGEPELAEQLMRQAIRLDPHSSRYLFGLGLAQLSMEQFYKSIETLHRALDMNDEDDWTYFLLAVANSYLNKESEANRAIDRFNELGSHRKGWVINHLPYIHLWPFQNVDDRLRLTRIVHVAGLSFQAGHDGE